jgi:hypothetical protein
MDPQHPSAPLLADAFRARYKQLQDSTVNALGTQQGDSVVLQRLGDDIADFSEHFDEVRDGVVSSTLDTNLMMSPSINIYLARWRFR